RKSCRACHVAAREPRSVFVSLRSHIEPKVHHVPFLGNIFLSFQAQLARLACASFTFAGDIVSKSNDFRPDETPLEIGMNHARSLGSRGPRTDSPRADFLLSGGKVRLQTK